MERIAQRHKDLANVLQQFSNSIELLNGSKKNRDKAEAEIIAFRDSVIKRFELSYDLLWKSLKDLLEKKYGIEIGSPKKVFLECFSQKLISESELKESLAMVDDRNMTTHTYSDEIAELVAQKIESHLKLMQKLYSLIIL